MLALVYETWKIDILGCWKKKKKIVDSNNNTSDIMNEYRFRFVQCTTETIYCSTLTVFLIFFFFT